MSHSPTISAILVLTVFGSLSSCDSSSDSNTSAPSTVPPSCLDYVCHWAGIDSSETTSTLEGTSLRIFDTIHLDLARDSTYRDWHVEGAYAGTTRYGYKPSSVSTGNWRPVPDSLQLSRNGLSRNIPASLSPNLLVMQRNGQDLRMTPH